MPKVPAKRVRISGTVAEYNINSNTFATVENAAPIATDANGNDFVLASIVQVV
jgi:hypothetical protein